MLLLRSNLVMKAGLNCWIWVQRCPNAGFLQGMRAGGAEKRLFSRKEQCLCSVVPGNNYIIQRLWVCVNQGWGPVCGPMWCYFETLCVCVILQKTFPSYTAQVNCELSKYFSLPVHTVYTLTDSFLNSFIPQVWLIFIFFRQRWY